MESGRTPDTTQGRGLPHLIPEPALQEGEEEMSQGWQGNNIVPTEQEAGWVLGATSCFLRSGREEIWPHLLDGAAGSLHCSPQPQGAGLCSLREGVW